MKKTWLFFTLILLLLLPLFISFAQEPVDLPLQDEEDEIGIDSSRVWDFGEVKEGSIVEHIFKIRNDSQENLFIDSVSTSCGCTVSEIAKKTLAPDEETDLKVKFNSKGYSGQTKQFVFVMTQSIDNPIIQFLIKADVKK